MRALLDTHILLWWLAGPSGRGLSYAQREVLESANPEAPLWVAEISLWEVALLVDLGRVELALPLRDWLERATAPPLVRRVGITPAIAAEVTALPESFPRDPADRLLAATARVMGATLLTRDRQILAAEVVPTLD